MEAQQRYREREKQQALAATFPWFQLIGLFSFYFLIGLLLSFLPQPLGVIAWVAVGIMSLFLLLVIFGQNTTDTIDSGSLFTDIICVLVIYILAKPVIATSNALSNVMKRRIFETTPPGPALHRKLDAVSEYCFLILILIEGAGSWLGHLTKTWFF